MLSHLYPPARPSVLRPDIRINYLFLALFQRHLESGHPFGAGGGGAVADAIETGEDAGAAAKPAQAHRITTLTPFLILIIELVVVILQSI